ncbi:MAG: hypothetical protein GXO29_03445 [Thermotogae bacterium]|nr:hypothetical protein [Thermotogota bacterium]
MLWLLLLNVGEINTLATVDIDGDGNSEIFLGTSEGLFLLRDGPFSTPEKVEGIYSPVLHISYYDDRNLLLTLDNFASPLVIVSTDLLSMESPNLTGRYTKAYRFNDALYLLSESGLFILEGDTLSLLLPQARDVTVCGVGGERRLFASSDRMTMTVGPAGVVDTLNLGSSFVVCGDTAVFTEYGSLILNGGRLEPRFMDFAYEPHTTVDGVSLKLRGNLLSVNGSPRGESRSVAFAAHRGHLYLIYGRFSLHAHPIYRPFLTSTLPFILKMGNRSTRIHDLYLLNSLVVGLIPVSPGEYVVEMAGKSFKLQVSKAERYDLTAHMMGDDPVSVSYQPGRVEIYVKLDTPSFVDVSIVSFTGKVVRHLYSGTKASSFKLYWDGSVAGGKRARRGVYFVRVKINGRLYNKRFIWLR